MEELGPSASLRRSAALTRGLRGALFGLSVLVFLIAIVLGFVPVIVAEISRDYVAKPADAVAIQVGVQTVLGIVITGFSGVLTTVCYYHLRRAKELIDVEEFVSAFDS